MGVTRRPGPVERVFSPLERVLGEIRLTGWVFTLVRVFRKTRSNAFQDKNAFQRESRPW